ncbi:hypothetical protein [Streptomyces microflavus]|uniref:Uncharacterized protein n=1 Tax=Streptomyces microflavus TaxID=1919 RepID=A0ABV1QE76_STRMI
MTTRARLGRLAVVAALAAGSVIAVGGVAQAVVGHDNVQADDGDGGGGLLSGIGDIAGGALGAAGDAAGGAVGAAGDAGTAIGA